MSQTTQKAPRAPRDLDKAIERAAAKLRMLEAERKEAARKEAQRNERAILECLRGAKLLEVPAEAWQQRIEDIGRLLSESAAEQQTGDPATDSA